MSITAAMLLVVQLALLITSPAFLSSSSLAPMTIVLTVSSLAGALITTFWPQPLGVRQRLSPLVKKPVELNDDVYFRSFQGSAAGSFSAKTGILTPSTMIFCHQTQLYGRSCRSWCHALAGRPTSWYLLKSLTATTSTSDRSRAILKAIRPIRPNPLMATRVFKLQPSPVFSYGYIVARQGLLDKNFCKIVYDVGWLELFNLSKL